MPTSIRIAPLLPVSTEVISALVNPLHSIFLSEIGVLPSDSNLVEPAFDRSRLQYNSTAIIEELLHRFPDPEIKVVGITSVDLFVPVLTYVFGEAQLDGKACVVSTYRLDNTIYGLADDPVLFFERTMKEVVHELGHTFGLFHCADNECAMHASTAVEDIDEKGSVLCAKCREQIGL